LPPPLWGANNVKSWKATFVVYTAQPDDRTFTLDLFNSHSLSTPLPKKSTSKPQAMERKRYAIAQTPGEKA
jgi:hypothetical protein